MLGFFPDLYPDELFYSGCARYQDHGYFPSKGRVSEQLFGNKHTTAWVHLPQHLDRFVASLPPQARFTSDDIINNHTTLPYLSPFISSERALQARADMKDGSGKTILNNIGVQSGLILLPEWLRFCALCVEDERERFGERYWHRIHQLSGVEVCPEHAVFLENSSARARYRASSNEYVSAERSTITNLARSVDLSKPVEQTLMRIAQDAKWLLCQQNLLPGCQALVDCYLKLLAEHGLATRSGFVRQERLKVFLANKYPPELWIMFHGVPREGNDWLIQMLYKLKTGKTVHPLLHLLMIQALEYTAEEFFGVCARLVHRKSENDAEPFGKAPWPCLNKTRAHYRQSTIHEYQLKYTREPNSRPMGIFACHCGFTYVRIGPDASAKDRYKIRRVESYGVLWETTLTKLWADASLSMQDICDRVGLGQWSVLKNQAARLGLPFPRVGPRGISKLADPGYMSTYFCKRIPGPQALSIYRREWTEGMKKSPEARTTKKLIQDKALALVYRRLLKHDYQWLDDNKPKSDCSIVASAFVSRSESYWEQLDNNLAPEAEQVAQQLRGQGGRPIRISRAAITREIGLRTQAFRQLNKLPKTAEVLAKYVETPVEFTVRKIRWAATCFDEEGIVPSRTKLMNRAGVGPKYWERIPIKTAADAALNALAKGTVALCGNPT
jgi:hypothetical protein